MYYDIASKVILSRCKEPFLSFFCGLSVKEAYLIESRPQETTSLRRADFVLKTILDNNQETLVLIEFFSSWKSWYPLRTLECRCRHILQENLPVITFCILFTPSTKAQNYYQDDEVNYQFNLVKLYEIDAREVLEKGPPCLLAFIPLLKDGYKFIDEAEKKIYHSNTPKENKADLLTGMAILGGLISEEIPLKLIQRRRDIMIESAAYEIIKKEGYEEGLKEGIQQGIRQGLQQGLKQGLLEAIELGLKLKFGTEGLKLLPRIAKIERPEYLSAIKEAIEIAENLEEIEKLLN
ncbi:RpnC/YadD family protein [Thermodesulfatator autotrophicus]|uniref:Uncharacterized protein n=1 Tax=Thermodesulfatator autotrophicus TaxID=1795632 RepID=A0A177E723_9BACT|nr:hypothetical protein [Thermodesulfatator autotrophicus]OAG27588.1 hypothetical protein TH606_06005 [Thermodesulfatator autotrophicus]